MALVCGTGMPHSVLSIFFRGYRTAFLLLLLGISPIYAVSADEIRKSPLDSVKFSESEDGGYLPASQFYETAKELGLSPNDLRLRALFNPEAREQLESRPTEAPAPATQESQEGTKPKVFAHVKDKSGGTEVISIGKVLEPHLKMVVARKEEFKQIALDHLKLQQKKAIESFKLDPKPNCLFNKTDKTVFDTPLPNRAHETVGDILFVPPKYFTTNVKEIFGEGVKLVLYDSSKPSPYTLMAKLYEVTCLPYRIRATGSVLYQHYGEPALRNYDGNPHGDGKNLLE
ncbi:MAG: hypothetical protein KDD70_10640 [Bdellovibrionales bacterium]|nr:hypothetical protein [Bdellovibrionales bacterium]